MLRRLLVGLLLIVCSAIVSAQPASPNITADFFADAYVTVASPLMGATPGPWTGEQVIYTVRYYSAVSAEYVVREPNFDAFYNAGKFTTSSAEIINGRQYVVISLSTILFPMRSGEIVIDPTEIDVLETVFTAGATVRTSPLVIYARPLPPVPPRDFINAVGDFEIRREITPRQLTVGTPAELTVTISGAGSIPITERPALSAKVDIPEYWRMYPLPSETQTQFSGGRIVGERVFKWQIIPDRAGSYVFGDQSVTYFDPITGYETISFPSITLEVLPGEGGVIETNRFNRNLLDQGSALKPVSLTAPPTIMQSPMLATLWGLPPVVALLVWGGLSTRRTLMHRRIEQRRHHALGRASQRLKMALDLNGQQAYLTIRGAIEGYLSDKTGGKAIHLVEAGEVMVAQGVNAELAARLIACAVGVDELRFSPQDPELAGQWVKDAAQALKAVDDAWRD